MTVHQILPTWEPGGIGAHALGVWEALRGAGVDCKVWADDVRPGLPPIARPTPELLDATAHEPDAVLLFHTAMGTPTADALLDRREPLVLDHHNITPPAFFDAWEPALAENLELANRQVARLARRSVLGLADSSFNASELARDGCPRTAVVPVFADYARQPSAPATATLREAEGGAVWLFVGRIAPNKAQHDVVRAFACYRRWYDPRARLRLVGAAPFAGYHAVVQRVAARLGVADAVDLVGPVADDVLAAHYATADVYVSLSQHEGFAVPIVEAMAAGLPVVALGVTAVPETAGDAALLVDRPDPRLVATAVARLLRDRELHQSVVAAGRERARAFEPARSARALLDALQPVLASSHR
jgi:glycosyltransferase involved in cell wall biosynthesis